MQILSRTPWHRLAQRRDSLTLEASFFLIATSLASGLDHITEIGGYEVISPHGRAFQPL